MKNRHLLQLQLSGRCLLLLVAAVALGDADMLHADFHRLGQFEGNLI